MSPESEIFISHSFIGTAVHQYCLSTVYKATKAPFFYFIFFIFFILEFGKLRIALELELHADLNWSNWSKLALYFTHQRILCPAHIIFTLTFHFTNLQLSCSFQPSQNFSDTYFSLVFLQAFLHLSFMFGKFIGRSTRLLKLARIKDKSPLMHT